MAEKEKKRILLADDDENLRYMLRALFEDGGYEIHEAATGEQALHQFHATQPELVLLDVYFGGMSGYEVLHELRRDPSGMDVPVIMLTGYAEEDQIVRGFEEGADDYVRKPFSPRELLARVESRIKRHSDTKIRLRHASDFRPGKVLIGAHGARYQVEERISRGGMGLVFRATCLDTGNRVAVKTLDKAYLTRAKEVQRFENEASATLRLDHPNLARGLDVVLSQELCFLVLQYIEGETLASTVARHGPLGETRTADVALQITNALAHLDAHDMLHRDVKPENILVAPDGHATLVDFGLAKSTVEHDAHLTTEGIILGTPYYLSPEQVKGMSRLDIRSDIYSLGATLYYLLSGVKPFDGTSTVSIINQRLFSDPLSVALVNPQVSSRMGAVVTKMMSRDISRRYQSPPDLRVDLKRVQAGQDPLLAGPADVADGGGGAVDCQAVR